MTNNSENDPFRNKVSEVSPSFLLEVHKLFAPSAAFLDTIRQLKEQSERASTELAKQLEGIAALFKNTQPIFEGLSKIGAEFSEHKEKVEALDRAGFLPHRTTPWHLQMGELSDEELRSSVLKYYAKNWHSVAADLQENLSTYGIDDEAKASFSESLKAHEVGLYRSVVRNLLCEIERTVRTGLFGNDFGSHVSGQFLKQIGDIPFGYVLDFVYGFFIYQKISEHLYTTVKNDESRKRFESDPVPNRHAAIHGLIAYNSAQNSINTLIMSDFLLYQAAIFSQFLRDERILAKTRLFQSYLSENVSQHNN